MTRRCPWMATLAVAVRAAHPAKADVIEKTRTVAGLSVTYNFAGGSTTVPMVLQSSGVYQYVIPSSANTWSVGTYSMTFASTDNPAVGTYPNPVTLTVN